MCPQASLAQASKNIITLRGSTAIVTEFFGYCINSVLYQRGLYPADLFAPVKKYSLQMMVTTDPGLSKYLANVLTQLTEWLVLGSVQKLVLVITNVDTNQPVQRWVFDIQTDRDALNNGKTFTKSEKDIAKEIQAIMRQITSSVSFLPLLDFPCAFDLLVYTAADVAVPTTWEESDPRYISKSNEVRLRSFTTKVHKVDAMVSYRADDA